MQEFVQHHRVKVVLACSDGSRVVEVPVGIQHRIAVCQPIVIGIDVEVQAADQCAVIDRSWNTNYVPTHVAHYRSAASQHVDVACGDHVVHCDSEVAQIKVAHLR